MREGRGGIVVRGDAHHGLAGVLAPRRVVDRAMRLAERAASSNIPVMIEGESGVGKEQIARAIHNASDRKGKAFVSFNCASLTEETLENKLFGREKSPENRKADKHTSKIVEANNGTLYLAEIGKLSLPLQLKLLRVLQEGEVEPIGARRPTRIDIRLICSTQSNILDLVKIGRFREDLFYRLNVIPITVPRKPMMGTAHVTVRTS